MSLDDLRTFTRSLMAIQHGMDREMFVRAVVDRARQTDGDEMWAARIARHQWDSARH